MPRNFATLGPSELQPPFTGGYKRSKKLFFLILQHWAGVSLNTSFYKLAETCAFIKQSLSPILCQLKKVALYKLLLLQSYGVILPSSFNIINSSALIYSICLPVSVLSTVFNRPSVTGFVRNYCAGYDPALQ